MKLKKGDQIEVTTGNYKGKKGKIEKIFPKRKMVLVPGINVVKKHLKPQGQKRPGGIVDVVRPILISKVALICPKCQKPTRIGWLVKNKEKVRRCKKCQNLI